MSRLIVGPFNRVEGDLEVRLDIADGHVREAHVVSPLYRGFERMLIGKTADDALVYAPRICGICSVSQSVAAAHALADAQQLKMPPNGRLAVNLIHATENVADHLTHFYLFFMPDVARAAYAAEPWHADAVKRFRAMEGTASREMLAARAQFMHLMGILAGKWPHTLGIRPGGSTRAVTANELGRMSGILAGFRRFLEHSLFGDQLERIIGLSSQARLDAWADGAESTHGDFRRFLAISKSAKMQDLGRASDRFLSYGAYDGGGTPLFARGVYGAGGLSGLDASLITEDTHSAWYGDPAGPRGPFDGETRPDPERESGYTWCKAPRLDGEIVEVGALARQAVAGHPLARDMIALGGGNVHARVVARLLEIAIVVTAMDAWVADLEPGEPFCSHGAMPDGAFGIGLTEAARGSLGHWLKVEGGRIANYQIVAPTTWNFSPRDADGCPGALERALVGAPVSPGESEPVAVQHIVRSFDPCMVCTVH